MTAQSHLSWFWEMNPNCLSQWAGRILHSAVSFEGIITAVNWLLVQIFLGYSHHFDYSATFMQNLCVYMPPAVMR